ncbi:MAG: tRNA (adenosine(37)-N6)-threonylcarbamoyltransferase complex ATPase subunit type 1 TsaE [Patescibacteria group bacterium]
MRFISKSEKETYNLAKKFAAKLKGGEVLCLIGDLGAGKTAFTKGLAKGLGVKDIITSPTFVLMKNYPIINNRKQSAAKTVGGKGSAVDMLAHIDAYRLDSGAQLQYIGVEEYFKDKNCVTVIEWADRVRDIWPKKVIKIKFKILSENKREIKITTD